jgi:phage terminase large subunit-like protein
VNANNVYIVDGGYVKPYFDELAFFPNGKNDDQVDASSGAFQLLARNKTRLGVL